MLLHDAEDMLNFTSGEERHMEKVSVAVTWHFSVLTIHMQIFKEIANSGVKIMHRSRWSASLCFTSLTA